MNKDKEPLMNYPMWLNSKNIKFPNYEDITEYAKYHTKWHLNNVKEVVCEEANISEDINQGEYVYFVDKQSITKAVEKYINENL